MQEKQRKEDKLEGRWQNQLYLKFGKLYSTLEDDKCLAGFCECYSYSKTKNTAMDTSATEASLTRLITTQPSHT